MKAAMEEARARLAKRDEELGLSPPTPPQPQPTPNANQENTNKSERKLESVDPPLEPVESIDRTHSDEL